MKTVLIPTDFKTVSLEPIPVLVKRFYPEKLNVIMVHMMGVTDCIRELLMLSRRSAEYQHISQDFYNACAHLKIQHNSQLNNIRIEFFYGNTIAAFKNFLEANDVDAILQMDDYDYQLLNSSSIHPAALIKRSGKALLRVDNVVSIDQEVIKAAPALQVEAELTEQYV